MTNTWPTADLQTLTNLLCYFRVKLQSNLNLFEFRKNDLNRLLDEITLLNRQFDPRLQKEDDTGDVGQHVGLVTCGLRLAWSIFPPHRTPGSVWWTSLWPLSWEKRWNLFRPHLSLLLPLRVPLLDVVQLWPVPILPCSCTSLLSPQRVQEKSILLEAKHNDYLRDVISGCLLIGFIRATEPLRKNWNKQFEIGIDENISI